MSLAVVGLPVAARPAAAAVPVHQGQELVEIRHMETPQGPPQMELALAKQMFQQFVSGQADPRIKAAYPYAGERAGTLIIEVDSADELSEVMVKVPVPAGLRGPLPPGDVAPGRPRARRGG